MNWLWHATSLKENVEAQIISYGKISLVMLMFNLSNCNEWAVTGLASEDQWTNTYWRQILCCAPTQLLRFAGDMSIPALSPLLKRVLSSLTLYCVGLLQNYEIWCSKEPESLQLSTFKSHGFCRHTYWPEGEALKPPCKYIQHKKNKASRDTRRHFCFRLKSLPYPMCTFWMHVCFLTPARREIENWICFHKSKN